MKHSTYRDLISGSQTGALPGAARLGLEAAALVYAAAVRTRNRGFDLGLLRTHRAPVPVVSVGNLTVGGTGKTPMVAAVVEWFASRGARPVILSRGYRSVNDAANDEKLVLAQLCPSIVHLQSPNRVRSAAVACRSHQADVLVLDDGFQHRRLERDLDIVLVDALDPWGNGKLLPRGLLREPRSALKRAGLIILTRADQCTAAHKEQIVGEIRTAWGGQLPVEAIFRPVGLVNSAGERVPADSLRNGFAAFCGIGNPEGFRRTLDAAAFGGRLAGFRAFDDHHHYTAAELVTLAEWARSIGACALVMTQKDLVKIPQKDVGGLPLWALEIRVQITAGAEEFDSRLKRLVQAEVQANGDQFQ